MIGGITKGSCFSGCVEYALALKEKNKEARLLYSEGLMTDTPKDIIDGFECQRHLNSRVKHWCGHISLSYSPKDAERKELESLKASVAETPEPAPTPQPKRVYYESDEIKKFMQRVSDVCDYRIQQREVHLPDRFVGKTNFEKFRKSINEKFISSEAFTKYQEEIDTRLKSVEEKAGQGISLMAINRYYGKKPEGYKSIFDNYMVLNLKRTQFHGCLPVIVFLFIASFAGLFWYLSKH